MITQEYIREFAMKQKTAFIGSVDGEGFPNIKAVFVPRKIEGNSQSVSVPLSQRAFSV